VTKNSIALFVLLSTIAALLAIGWHQERKAADSVIATQAAFIQELLADAHEVSAAEHQQRTVRTELD
jgi:hypothetical protein